MTGPDRLTRAEALDRLPDRTPPSFWVGGEARLEEVLADLERGTVREVGTSPGDRPIRAVTYGEATPPERRANFNSAVAAREPARYASRPRDPPVVLLIGPVHGHEVEGLTGLANLLSVIETGRDLRGTRRGRLRTLADRCRVVVVPDGNPDGLARFAPDGLYGQALADLRFWGQGTHADGRLRGWPSVKRRHPMTDDVGFLGCYFDDAGVNPMHDEFFAPMGPEAPALLALAREEAPDVTVSLHSHGNAPAFHRSRFVPLEVQERVRGIWDAYAAALAEAGLPAGTAVPVEPETGSPPPSFNLVSALYHVSGTTPVLHECPHGLAGEEYCTVTPDEILDVQLALYRSLFRAALGDLGDGTDGGEDRGGRDDDGTDGGEDRGGRDDDGATGR
jgi:hypothetical protein